MHRPCQLCPIRANYFYELMVVFCQGSPVSFLGRFRTICTIMHISSPSTLQARTMPKAILLAHTRTLSKYLWQSCHTVAQLSHCCPGATLLHNCHSDVSATLLQNCHTSRLFTFCSFVWSTFVSLLFSALNKAGTKRDRDPPSGGQLFYSPVRSFRGVFWKPIDTIVNI
jgi:hypothetical protein